MAQMPDRLAELVRQRALVQEHLGWLNREIAAAAETARVGPPGESAATNPPAAAAPVAPAIPGFDADEIAARYQVSPVTVKNDVRKGCLLYFVAGLGLLVAATAGLYFLLRQAP